MTALRPLMVLGCTSDAGKSLLVTALCAWFRREGVRVAPFKAQNMSNNARVVATPHGNGEIGVAQWLQASAAGLEPDVRMNPVLLKPEADTQSQVVVRGVVDRELTAMLWQDRHDALWIPMVEGFDDLAAEFDLVVIEGAGSPAEINLVDQVNNRMVEHADATALLISDIDRGGSFAHLYGTWALVPEATRDRLAGYVLNKFRGDPTLLAPGPGRLTEMTGMANAGVLPMLRHRLPREEGAVEHGDAPAGAPSVAIPRLPFGSNLDEFHMLSHAASVRWATDAASFERADFVILPGSKHVVADLAWMRERGLDVAVARAAAAGTPVIGVCGGAMMLGMSLDDPNGAEGFARGAAEMLGLLPLRTMMADDKLTVRSSIDWEGEQHDGYEIRYGRVSGGDDLVVARSALGPVGWRSGNVVATTIHGLFEDPAFVERLLGVRISPVLDDTFAQLADAVEQHLDTDLLRHLTST
ncbi:cobyric acid synthase [Ilumatobacter sp.]|uniref:cobyric acid synthase n=1 Tax=Ilumatobacter sp. TaxID=1967498 RepID=UPI0037522B8B